MSSIATPILGTAVSPRFRLLVRMPPDPDAFADDFAKVAAVRHARVSRQVEAALATLLLCQGTRSGRDAAYGRILRQLGAARQLERLFANDRTEEVSLASVLVRYCRLERIFSGAISRWTIAAQDALLPTSVARSLIVMLQDLLHYLAEGMPESGTLEIYLAAGWWDGHLIVSLAAPYARIAAVPNATAAAALARAGRISALHGGTVVRGVEADTTILGIVFPDVAMEVVRPGSHRGA